MKKCFSFALHFEVKYEYQQHMAHSKIITVNGPKLDLAHFNVLTSAKMCTCACLLPQCLPDNILKINKSKSLFIY